MIDIHSHILPGLDDGAQTIKDSLAMARVAVQDGITTIIATPHLFRSVSHWSDFSLLAVKRKELQRALDREGLPLTILGGVEFRFSHNLLEEIRNHRENLVLNRSAYMFIEFPFDYVYSGVKDVFFQVMSEGIIPVITHPERCTSFSSHPELLYELMEMGALVQVNAGSFDGHYGRTARDAVYRFLSLNYVHFIATDAHDTESRPPLLSPAVKNAGEVIGAEAARALVQDNPAAVIEDKPIPYQPDPISPEPSIPEKHFKLRIPTFFKSKRED